MSSNGDIPTTRGPGGHERIHEQDEETTRLMLQADRILARLMRDEDQASGRHIDVGQAPLVLRSAERALVRARRLARRAAHGDDGAVSTAPQAFDADVAALTAALDALVDDRRQGQGSRFAAFEKLAATCRSHAQERRSDLVELRSLAAEVLQLGRALQPAGDAAADGRLESLGAALREAEPAVLVPQAEAVLHDLTTVLKRRQSSDQSEAAHLHGEIAALRQTLATVEQERATAVDACSRLAEQDAAERTRRERLLATIPLLRTAVQINLGAIEMASGEIAAAGARIAVMGEDRQAHLERKAVAEDEYGGLQERLHQANERSMTLRQHCDQLSLALDTDADHPELLQEQQLAVNEMAAVRDGMRDLLERSVLSRRDAERAGTAADHLARAMEQARSALRSSQRRLAELTVRCRSLSEECDRLQAEVGTPATAPQEVPLRPSTAIIPAAPPSTRRRKRRITATDGPVPRIEEVEPTWIDDPARQSGEAPSTWGGDATTDDPPAEAGTASGLRPQSIAPGGQSLEPGNIRPAATATPGPAGEATPDAPCGDATTVPATVGDEVVDLPPAAAPTTAIAAITRRVLPAQGMATPRPVLRIDTRRSVESSSSRSAIPCLLPSDAPGFPREETAPKPLLQVLLVAIAILLLILAVLATLVVIDRWQDGGEAPPLPVTATTAPHHATVLALDLRQGFSSSSPDRARIADDGSAQLSGGTLVAAGRPEWVDTLMKSGDFTLELHLRAAANDGAGAACLLSWAASRQERNLAIIQNGSALELRLRTSATQPDGTRPHLVSGPGVVTTGDQLLSVIRRGEQLSLRVDGATVATAIIPGDLSTWERGAALTLGGEVDGATWQGVISAVVLRAGADD